ncbi:MAG TPA: DegT/DnrJ/EryC1/StrS family aminotransferase [Thiotrichales bacterium]|nr:DegT/DnrJ/EryC1/StrS family aminotransferase [Thiotrichales bacterium]
MKRIPFFDYRAHFGRDEEGFLKVIRDVCARGAFILQRDLEEFERRLAEFVGVRHAIGVGNGTDAIWIGLMAVGVGPGDEVILPSHTFVATAAAVKLVGATPILADIGPDRMVDPASVEAAITPRTKAILPVQLNGRTCDMDALHEIADRHGLMIVEDAAQALGSRFRGRCAGTFGRFGTISFYPAKLLGCFGDGGAVLTNDDEVADRIHALRDHGRSRNGEVVSWGFNSRLDNLQAALLNYQLRRYRDVIERRRAIAMRYHERLADVAELGLPPAPDADPRHFDVYQNYEIEADRRDALRDHLAERGVQTHIQWGGRPVHGYRALGFDGVRLPRTEAFFERCLLLPMNPFLTDDDVDYVCDCIRAFYGYGS